MPALKDSTLRCDVNGCGMLATLTSDGSEVDVQGLKRPAVPKLNVCARHTNWPHSDDAKIFALQQGRK